MRACEFLIKCCSEATLGVLDAQLSRALPTVLRYDSRMSPAKPSKPSKSKTQGSPASEAATANFTPFRVKHAHDVPLYDQVRQGIRDQITAGKLLPGQRLPPMRQLCTELNIAYATVARAIRQLVEEGVLEAKTGRGTSVALRRSARLQTIGLLGMSSFKEFMRDSRYYNRLIHLLQEELLDHGQVVAYARWPEKTPLSSLFQGLQQIDGLLLCKISDEQSKEVAVAQRMGVPIIGMGDTFNNAYLPAVDSDNFNDTRRLTQAIINQGHRHIAFVSEPAQESLRMEGFESMMKEAGLAVPSGWAHDGPFEQWGKHVLKLSPRPTAIIINGAAGYPHLDKVLKGSDLDPRKGTTLGVYDDNLWQTVAPLKVPYFRVDQPLEAIATAAVAELMKMLKDKHYHPKDVLLPSQVLHVDADGNSQEV